MPEPLTTKIDNWRIIYSYIWSDLYNAHTHLRYAAEQAEAENWSGLSLSLGMVSNYIGNVAGHFRGGSDNLFTTMYSCMDWIDKHWSAGAEITMDSILNVMLSASFSQLQKFIGIVDAYRVALWNAPFNTDFYAALARGFQKWP